MAQVPVGEFILDGGKYAGRRLGDLGNTYLGYGYIKYKAREGESSFVEYLVEFPHQPSPTWEECKDYELQFGKYRGKKIYDLAGTLEGRSYLSYLSTWEDMNEREIITRMVNAFPQLPLAPLDTSDWQMWEMPFGKFKGVTMAEAARRDRGYLKYMRRQMGKKPSAQNDYLAARIDCVLGLAV